MTEDNLNYIISVLKNQSPIQKEIDWIEIIGFLQCHRITGLFYHRAKFLGIDIPPKAEKILSEIFLFQKKRVQLLRNFISEMAKEFIEKKVNCAFLKGSVLCNFNDSGRIYADGERVSNDIDLLVKSSELSAVSEVLKSLGYVQGVYQKETSQIKLFDRLEILRRRMTRGEMAPFVRLTDDPYQPFIEIDINFSLGNTPSERQDLLEEMIETKVTMAGQLTIPSLNREMFFLHLIFHQYKESCLYFSVERGKDLDLYKLADIYYLWQCAYFDKNKIFETIIKYKAQKEAGSVLAQVASVFDDRDLAVFAESLGDEQPLVIDYQRKKTYYWTVDVRERLKHFCGINYLKEMDFD